MDNVVKAILLAVALFSVMLAKGLSASPQHSIYFGCRDLDVSVPPPEFPIWPVIDPDPDEVVLPLVDPLCDRFPLFPLDTVPS